MSFAPTEETPAREQAGAVYSIWTSRGFWLFLLLGLALRTLALHQPLVDAQALHVG